MLRVFLLAVALSQAVLAFPDNLQNRDELEREIDNLERLLQEKNEGNRAAEDLMDEEREIGNEEEGEMMEWERASNLRPISLVGKPAVQSTTHSPYTAAKAVDGNRDTQLYPSAKCSHTLEEKFPWWKVDLGEERCIGRIEILNRGDCCSDRLAGAIVRAGTKEYFPSNGQCGRTVTASDARTPGGTIVFICSPPLRARYISVGLPKGGILQLCEVTAQEVDLGQCAASDKALSVVGKPAEQSSTHNPYTAAKAVDGDRDTNLYPGAKCSHTLEENNPWWRVDLGSDHCISSVTILNRGDCCSDRLTGAVVRVGEFTCGAPVTAAQASPRAGTIKIECDPPLRADFVKIEIPGSGILQLCEVTVDEIDLGLCPSMENEFSIVGRPASQSSDYSGTSYKAELAADGNMGTTLYPRNECTHTREEMNPWWKVALDGVHCVTKVTLLNRGDCCSDRLEGAVVRAGTSESVLDNAVCGSPVTSGQAAPRGGTIDIVCDRPLKAKYVSVNIPSKTVLQLCEVMVKEMTLGYC